MSVVYIFVYDVFKVMISFPYTLFAKPTINDNDDKSEQETSNTPFFLTNPW